MLKDGLRSRKENKSKNDAFPIKTLEYEYWVEKEKMWAIASHTENRRTSLWNVSQTRILCPTRFY